MLLSRSALTVAVILGVLILGGIAWAVLRLYEAPRQAAAAAAASMPAPAPLPASVDLVGRATIAIQACTLPSPPTSPDGATASLNQMLAARSDFQAYDAATNAYVHCVDAAIQKISQDPSTGASKEDLESLTRFGVRAHNTAIDEEQAHVDQFNVQLRSYKDKHPHK
jgi:hypothetical protein